MSLKTTNLRGLLWLSMLAGCRADSAPVKPTRAPPPVAAASPKPPAHQAPWADRQLVEMPVQEDWVGGLLTGGYRIGDKQSGRTFTAPEVGKIQDQVFPVAPDRGHVFLEFVSGEGPTIVVDYELGWLEAEGRFSIDSKSIQAIDGKAHYTYERSGELFKRSQ